MFTVWNEELDNRGVTIIESCIIIPIFIMILYSFVILYVQMLDIAMIQGNIYSSLYSIRCDETKEEITYKLQDSIEGSVFWNNDVQIDVIERGDIILSVITIDNGGIRSITEGDIEKHSYSIERDKTSGRLRRWQLYGDVYNKAGDE